MEKVLQDKEKMNLLLKGVQTSIGQLIPINHELVGRTELEGSFLVRYGVFIGFSGDIAGKLFIGGDRSLFSFLGKSMFGMDLEGEMLTSFSGELGNMIAGGSVSAIEGKGMEVDITSPTILDGHSFISGYTKGYILTYNLPDNIELHVHVLID
ncbi:chemotaxis protein CheX [Cytobacillus kochii]|uniref:chemotaxis protein CheX n=1 Tax=Cytobacillus kochii TaxID=859143 RepID=UPI00402B01B0